MQGLGCSDPHPLCLSYQMRLGEGSSWNGITFSLHTETPHPYHRHLPRKAGPEILPQAAADHYESEFAMFSERWEDIRALRTTLQMLDLAPLMVRQGSPEIWRKLNESKEQESRDME